jgi:diaminopimelate dehydrogenase
MDKIKVGIVGYGNLGKGVKLALDKYEDMELVAVFTRRDVEKVQTQEKMVHISEVEAYQEKIDVMILCGGSATDLPEQGPQFAKLFNTVDSFDTHSKIPAYFSEIDSIATKAGKVSVISTGWDPGLFSLARLLGQSVLPEGKDYTFWGKGVSQGHSDAIRRVKGVKNGIQYTIPIESALNRVRAGENPELSTREKHLRVCYIVLEEGADEAAIISEIKNMPAYFVDYETEVNMISEEELKANHTGMPHGGFVMRSGITGENTKQLLEFSLKLESNPEFTGSVLVAYARAVARLAKEGQIGAKSVFDIPFSYLTSKSQAELLKELL